MDELNRSPMGEVGGDAREGVAANYLKRALDALDARAARRAARVNVERVAARVVERLRSEPEAAPLRSFALPRALRVAAAVALLVAGGVIAGTLLRDQPSAGGSAGVSLPVPSTALDSLSPTQADSLLRAIGEIRALNVVSAPSSGSVEELSAEELRALLQAMETSEGGSL